MSPIPCPCCEGGALTRCCPDTNPNCPGWERCVQCDAIVHHYRIMAKSGLRQHSHPTHSPVQPADCKLCAPTWDPRLKGARP